MSRQKRYVETRRILQESGSLRYHAGIPTMAWDMESGY
jgi:hypothetical protein